MVIHYHLIAVFREITCMMHEFAVHGANAILNET